LRDSMCQSNLGEVFQIILTFQTQGKHQSSSALSTAREDPATGSQFSDERGIDGDTWIDRIQRQGTRLAPRQASPSLLLLVASC
jgi:hypothetical protein